MNFLPKLIEYLTEPFMPRRVFAVFDFIKRNPRGIPLILLQLRQCLSRKAYCETMTNISIRPPLAEAVTIIIAEAAKVRPPPKRLAIGKYWF